MKLILRSLPLLLSSLASAMPQLHGGSCPTTGACHIPRWEPDDLGPIAQYGWAVDVEGNTAVVGAPQNDAVYVYRRVGGQWAQVQRLSGTPGTQFGEALCLDGDELLIGAPLTDVDDGASLHVRAGAAHLYERVGGAWTLADTLVFSFPTHHARFGTGVDKLGDRIAIGSPRAWFTEQGTVAVFDRDGSGWSETVALDAADSIGLGQSVAIDGPYVLGGDNVNDTFGDYAGMVYAWEETGAGWSAAAPLSAPGIVGGSFLGYSVSARDGWVAAGAYGSNGTGQVLMYRHDAGTGQYEHESTLSPCGEAPRRLVRRVRRSRRGPARRRRDAPGPAGNAQRPGPRVRAADARRHLGARGLARARGRHGLGHLRARRGDRRRLRPRRRDLGGRARRRLPHVPAERARPRRRVPVQRRLATVRTFGTGKPGTGGIPQLELSSPPGAIGTSTTVRLANALPGARPVLGVGSERVAIPFGGGELYVAGPRLLRMPAVSGAGTSELTWDLPADPSLCGTKLVMQSLFVEPGTRSTVQSPGLVLILGY